VEQHQSPLKQDDWRRRQRSLVDEAVILGRKGSNVEAIVDGKLINIWLVNICGEEMKKKGGVSLVCLFFWLLSSRTFVDLELPHHNTNKKVGFYVSLCVVCACVCVYLCVSPSPSGWEKLERGNEK